MSFDVVTCDLHGPDCSVGVFVEGPTPGHDIWNLVIQDYMGEEYSYIGLTVRNIDELISQLWIARAALTV